MKSARKRKIKKEVRDKRKASSCLKIKVSRRAKYAMWSDSIGEYFNFNGRTLCSVPSMMEPIYCINGWDVEDFFCRRDWPAFCSAWNKAKDWRPIAKKNFSKNKLTKSTT